MNWDAPSLIYESEMGVDLRHCDTPDSGLLPSLCWIGLQPDWVFSVIYQQNLFPNQSAYTISSSMEIK